MSDSPSQDLVDLLNSLHYSKYGALAALTVVIYDYCITVDDEISLIWPSRWSITKVLFLLNRYSPFIDGGLGLHLSTDLFDRNTCAIEYQILAYSATLGLITAECILMVRTYAIWCRNKSVLWFLVLLGIATYVPILTLIGHFLRSLRYPDNTVLHYTACIPLSASDEVLWVVYALHLAPETAVIILTLVNRYQTAESFDRPPPILNILYRDGMLAYFAILGMVLVNITVMVIGPPAISSMVQEPIRILHSALCTRVVLNLRKAALCGRDADSEDTMRFISESYIAYEDIVDLPR